MNQQSHNASVNFAKMAKIREFAKFNLAKINPIKVIKATSKKLQDCAQRGEASEKCMLSVGSRKKRMEETAD